jgi:hypothetical protein
MNQLLISKLNHKQNLEAQWASKLLANGEVTVSMVKISKEIKDVEREIKEVTEQKKD